MAAALAFGQQDETWNAIATLLEKRNCKTVGDWRAWTKGEFLTLLNSGACELKRHRNAYLVGFEQATGHNLSTFAGLEPDPFAMKEKKATGGDLLCRSRKVAASAEFVASKWQPDALVFDGVPRASEKEYFDKQEEELYLDKLWLSLQVSTIQHSNRSHSLRGVLHTEH